MEKVESFKIIGISVSTSNQDGQNAQDLGNLWSQFFSNDLLEKIPNSISKEIFCIYTDYESNFKGSYTAILGLKVSSFDAIPEGLISRELPAGNFMKFTAKGIIPNAVIDTWEEIWADDQQLKRKYTYDFEVYGEKSQNGELSEVDIFIAI